MRYGDAGSAISGCVREYFPDHVKNLLRWLAHSVSDHSDRAVLFRPARVRTETMHNLGRAVTCAEGKGFYGYCV